MEETARLRFDDKDIQEIRILVRLTVEFHDFLTSTPPWPAFPDDPFHNMTYTVDRVLFNIDSFRAVVHSYGILIGSTHSTIDWNPINIRSVKDAFVSVYQAFVAQTDFNNKCRLLLDLVKLDCVRGSFL